MNEYNTINFIYCTIIIKMGFWKNFVRIKVLLDAGRRKQ